jgi:3-oxoacyl-[acyl-carrier protein] reductase
LVPDGHPPLTGVLAKELAKRTIRANSVNPGFTLTEGTNSYLGSDFVSWPRYRWVAPVNPKKFFAIVAFLASSDSGWLTGELINASGGLR